ncbi:MAG: hypothetical protein JO266_21735 [Acidobacteria bacterium]|nr:hypothetical protein [Acidobacteriota bacterium]
MSIKIYARLRPDPQQTLGQPPQPQAKPTRNLGSNENLSIRPSNVISDDGRFHRYRIGKFAAA